MELVSTEKQPALLADLERQVQTCLGCWFNETLTAEYRQALSSSSFLAAPPDLVAHESPLVNFLRTERWHPLRAAKRLALYWKLRKDLFGAARFLRPLHQTGAGGALTAQQVAMVRSGFLAVTTTTTTTTTTNNNNNTKHPVLIVDHSRLPKTVKSIDPAVVFYLISVTSCAAAAAGGQCPGYTIVHVIQRGLSSTVQPLSGPMIQRMLQSMPFTVHQVLIVVRALRQQPQQQPQASGAEQHWLDNLAYKQQAESDLHLGRRGAAKCVTGDSVQTTVKLLQECGVDKSCIPVDLGGDYVYSTHFEEWIQKQLTEERALIVAAPPIGNTTLANAATTRAIAEIVMRATTATTSTTQQQQQDGMLVAEQRPGESRTDFEKRRRKLYGKRAYKKKRYGEAQLQQQRNHLQQCIAALRTDNRRMEALLVRARFILAQHNNNNTKKNNNSHCTGQQG